MARVLAVATLAAGVSQAFGRFTYSLLLTDVRRDFDISYTLAGSIGSANLAAYLAGTLVVSLVVGRAGLSRLTRLGLTGVTIALVAMAWGPSVGVLLPAMVLAGFSGAAVWVTAPGLAAAALGAERRGLAIGIVGTGIGMGIVLASLLEATIAADTWRTVYRVEAAIAVVTLAAALFVFRDGPPAGSSQSGRDAITKVPRWRRLIVSYGLYGFAMSLFVSFLVAVLEEDAGYSARDASLAFSSFGFGTIFGGPLFGPMSDRFGRSWSSVTAYGAMIAAAIVVPTGARPWAVIFSFVFGLAFTGVPTSVAARISDHVAAESFGAAFAVATLSFGFGLAIGPQLGGAIGDATNSFRPVFVICTIAAAIAATLSWETEAPGDDVPCQARGFSPSE